jgi:hypothetical protein
LIYRFVESSKSVCIEINICYAFIKWSFTKP